MSPSSRRAWIEIVLFLSYVQVDESPSSRRAWIEIQKRAAPSPAGGVALLAEGVDRNFYFATAKPGSIKSPSSRRAWIEIA